MIETIRDSMIDILRAHINSISNLSERMVRISRIRGALDLLSQEAEAQKPIDFPLWATYSRRGSYTSSLWIRCDVAEEAHALALEYTFTKKEPWGIDECGNEANPLVPYFVYLVQGNDVYRRMNELLGKAGSVISGMGSTEKKYINKIIGEDKGKVA